MWQYWQRIIKEEAEKYGYGKKELNESGVKAAIEDFMYDMLPKQAISELKPIMKNQSIRGADLRNKVTAVLKKHKVPLMHLGGSSAQLVIDYFDTFHGESVEVNEENLNIGTYGFRIDRDSGKFVLYQLSYSQGSVRFPDGRKGTVIGRYATRDEAIAAAKRNAGVKEEVETVEEGVRMMAGVEKMLRDEGHPSMVSSLRKIKKTLEGKPTGSVLVVTKEKSPESMSIKVYAPSDFASLIKGLTKKPEAKVGSKGSWSGGEVTVVAIKEEVEVAEQFKAGDKVKVPHKGKMVSGKIVRFDSGGTDKARQHGGGYVVDVGEPASILVPKQNVRKEEVEQIDELTVPQTHALAIARKTVRMNDAMVGVMGGMNKKQAHEFLLKHGTPAEKKAAAKYLRLGEEVEQIEEVYDGAKSRAAMQSNIKKAPTPKDKEELVKLDNAIKKSPKVYGISMDYLGDLAPGETPSRKKLTPMAARAADGYDAKNTDRSVNLGIISKINKRIKEEVEIEEAKVKYLTGPGKKDSKRIIGIYTMSGKWVKDMNSEREAAAFVNKSWGESVEEEEDMIGEDNWGGGFETSREAQAKVQAGLRADAKKRQMLIISALQKVIDGQMSKVAFKKLTGSSYADIMSLPFYSKKVKMKKEEVENFDEAYARPNEKPIGAFTLAGATKFSNSAQGRFEYRISEDSWGKSHGLPHEVCVSSKDPTGKQNWRAANVKGTVCIIALDEDAEGKPVLEKWAIRNHVKYVKAEETDQEGEVIEEQDRAAVQGSKMVYVGQRLRALQSKSMMSGSVVKGETYKVATNKDGKVDLVHQSIGYRTAVRNVDATTIEALIKNRVLS